MACDRDGYSSASTHRKKVVSMLSRRRGPARSRKPSVRLAKVEGEGIPGLADFDGDPSGRDHSILRTHLLSGSRRRPQKANVTEGGDGPLRGGAAFAVHRESHFRMRRQIP